MIIVFFSLEINLKILSVKNFHKMQAKEAQVKPKEKIVFTQPTYTKIQRQQFIERMLHKEFPYPNYILVILIIINLILAFGLIAIQILSIVFKSPLYYFGAGL